MAGSSQGITAQTLSYLNQITASERAVWSEREGNFQLRDLDLNQAMRIAETVRRALGMEDSSQVDVHLTPLQPESTKKYAVVAQKDSVIHAFIDREGRASIQRGADPQPAVQAARQAGLIGPKEINTVQDFLNTTLYNRDYPRPTDRKYSAIWKALLLNDAFVKVREMIPSSEGCKIVFDTVYGHPGSESNCETRTSTLTTEQMLELVQLATK